MDSHKDKSIYKQLKIKGHTLRLETVASAEDRQKGLSGRSGMNQDEGMLFVFDETGSHCMWMKDMKFNIDILWLDVDGKINHIKKNVAPSTYPESFCAEGKYVVELLSGMAEQTQLRVGQHLNLK